MQKNSCRTDRFRTGELICFLSSREAILPLCYRTQEDRFATYANSGANTWHIRGKQIYVQLPAGIPSFGYVCGTEKLVPVVHAGSEWVSENPDYDLFVYLMLFSGPDSFLVEVKEMHEDVYRISDSEKEVLESLTGQLATVKEVVLAKIPPAL